MAAHAGPAAQLSPPTHSNVLLVVNLYLLCLSSTL